MKSDTVSTVSPSISHEVMGPEAMIYSITHHKCDLKNSAVSIVDWPSESGFVILFFNQLSQKIEIDHIVNFM